MLHANDFGAAMLKMPIDMVFSPVIRRYIIKCFLIHDDRTSIVVTEQCL